MVFPLYPAEVNTWSEIAQNDTCSGKQIHPNGVNVSQSSHADIESNHFETLDVTNVTSVGELFPSIQEIIEPSGCIICTILFDVQWGFCIPEKH